MCTAGGALSAREDIRSLELEIEVAVRNPVLVLATKLRSSRRAASVLNFWVISPTPAFHFWRTYSIHLKAQTSRKKKLRILLPARIIVILLYLLFIYFQAFWDRVSCSPDWLKLMIIMLSQPSKCWYYSITHSDHNFIIFLVICLVVVACLYSLTM